MDFPDLKFKALLTYPASIIGGAGIETTKQNGSVIVDMNWAEFTTITAVPTSPTNNILTFDTATGTYVMVPSSLLGGAVAGISDTPPDGILYGRSNPAGWQPIPVSTGVPPGSTTGYLLQTNGTGSAPTWNGFVQQGTSAVTRTWRDKGCDVVTARDFGADPTGATDSSAALQAAINYCISSGATLEIGRGVFTVNATLNITGKITIVGCGIFGTKIYPASNVKCFAINTTEAVTMRDMQITYPVTPLSGSNLPAIEVTAPDRPNPTPPPPTVSQENVYSRFSNLYIGAPSIGFSFLKASVWSIDGGCYIDMTNSAANCYGIYVDNQHLVDSGDSVITNTTILGQGHGGVASTGIAWVGSGGLRITNCKLNGANNAVFISLPANKKTADIFLMNNSIENAWTTGVVFQAGAGSEFNFLQISSNEIWSPVPIAINATGCILQGAVITDNTLFHDTTAPAVRLINVKNFTIDGNNFQARDVSTIGVIIDADSYGNIGSNSYNNFNYGSMLNGVHVYVGSYIENGSAQVTQTGEYLLATYTASNSASLSDIINLLPSFRSFRIVGHNLIPAALSTMLLQLYQGGSFTTTGYLNEAGGRTDGIDLMPSFGVGTTALLGWSGEIIIGEPGMGNHTRYVHGRAMTGNPLKSSIIAGLFNSVSVVTGFRILFTGGNIASGTIQLYGTPK